LQVYFPFEEVKAWTVNIFFDDIQHFLRNNPEKPSGPGVLSDGICFDHFINILFGERGVNVLQVMVLN
jgi:hypothetical protein